MDTLRILELIARIISPVTALLSVWLAYRTLDISFRARRELSLAEQIGNIHSMFVEAYLERRFRQPIRFGDIEVLTLKEARNILPHKIRPPNDQTFKEAREGFLTRTLDPSSWENKFAYEVSLGLQQVGIAVLSGAIPLSFVLASNADQIVEDWLYCYRLVKEVIRGRPGAPMPQSTKLRGVVHFHRMHAEWLAYASAIWLSNHWSGGHLQSLLDELGDIETLQKRERQLRTFASSLIPEATNMTIVRILGVLE
jgi:hypothetical protein